MALDTNTTSMVDERYELRSCLHRSGVAMFYEAWDHRRQRSVGLHVFHPRLSQNPDFNTRLRQEARAVARLAHPGITAVHDQGVSGEISYLVTDVPAGQPLSNVLANTGPMSVGRALNVFNQIADAVAAAHRRGVVHRNIGPSCIILNDGDVTVSDFAVARALGESLMATNETVRGTAAYVAPETLRDGSASTQADVYALGIILYELLTGHTPHRSSSPAAIAQDNARGHLDSIRKFDRSMPRAVARLISELTHPNPAVRIAEGGVALAASRAVASTLKPHDLTHAVQAPAVANVTDDPESAHRPGELGGHGTVELPVGALHRRGDKIAARTPGKPRPAPRRKPPQQPGARPAGPPSADQAAGSPPRGPRPAETGGGGKPPSGRRSRRSPWPFFIIGILLLAALAWLAIMIFGGDNNDADNDTAPAAATVMVPELEGMSEDEAVAAVESAGLVAEANPEFSDDVASGTVMNTDPSSGSEVDEGSTVELTISSGIEVIDVPDVVGMPQSEAEQEISDAGLPRGDVTTENHPEIETGSVISTTPSAGQAVPYDREVSLVVSSGPAPVNTPNLVGMDEEDARSELQRVGLEMTVVEEHDEDVAEGAIISQSPAAGTSELIPGDTVEVTISLGPPLVEVPDVLREDVDDARQILEDLGFEVEVENFLGGMFDTVRSQDPEPGEMVPPDTTVTLEVA